MTPVQRVRYADSALKDLSDIHAYIARENVLAASRVVDAIIEAISLLSLFPQKSRRVRGRAVRALPLSRYPYVIFYCIQGKELRITHIAHGARRHPGFQEEAAEFSLT
jgi:addiction module RelE/StbE family toxin